MAFRAFRLPFRATKELPYCVIALLPYCEKRVRLSRFAFDVRRMVSAIAPTSLLLLDLAAHLIAYSLNCYSLAIPMGWQ
jgi:hypothetical protein